RRGSRWLASARLALPAVGDPSQLGWSVALSRDGSTVLAGAPYSSGGEGAAVVFVHRASGWARGARLHAGGSSAGAAGTSVALSGDGSTALVGAPYDSPAEGAAYAFARAGSRWRPVGRLTARTGRWSELGASVALSRNGALAVLGAPLARDGAGRAYLFARREGRWVQRQELDVDGDSGEAGFSVAISGNGSVVLLGRPFGDGERGAAFVFVRSGAAWRERTALPGEGARGAGRSGYVVALSESGRVGLVGAPNDDGQRGAVYLYTRTGSAWRQRQKLTVTGAAGAAQAGARVALSARGTVALLAAPSDDGGQGAAYVFVRSGGGWRQRQKLPVTGAAGPVGGLSVLSVAVSADG